MNFIPADCQQEIAHLRARIERLQQNLNTERDGLHGVFEKLAEFKLTINRGFAEIEQSIPEGKSSQQNKKDCEKALSARAGTGFSTPLETYGTDTSWAIDDLCKALTQWFGRVGSLDNQLVDAQRDHAQLQKERDLHWQAETELGRQVCDLEIEKEKLKQQLSEEQKFARDLDATIDEIDEILDAPAASASKYSVVVQAVARLKQQAEEQKKLGNHIVKRLYDEFGVTISKEWEQRVLSGAYDVPFERNQNVENHS